MADEDENGKSGGEGEGAGGKSEPKPEIVFKKKADFHAEVDRKVNSAVKKAIEDTKRALLEQFGVESDEEIPTVVEAVKKGKTAATETEKLNQAHTKLGKEFAKLKESHDGLLGWKHKAIKQSALNAFASKTVDLELLTALVEPRIQIGEDDVARGPDGKDLEDFVEAIFKAKPLLKVPDNNAGAGTKPGGEKAKGGGDKGKPKAETPADEPKTNPSNGRYAKPQIGAAVVAALQALETDGSGGGP